MASHLVVIDASARRQQIKTTPGTYLRDVLEEACKKFGKNPDNFVLTDNSRPPKTLDLSLSFRLSGLVNGQRLQLVQGSRSPSVVNIALKLPESLGGQRLQDKFPSNTSLWLVLRKFEEAVAGGSAEKLNLTQRGVPSTQTGSGRLEYEQPVIKILQRELADFVSLQKTLAQLGYNSGSVLLQLEFRRSGKPMEEAVTRISEYFDAPSSSTTPAPPPKDGTPPPPAPAIKEAISAPAAPLAAGAHSGAVGQMSSLPDADAIDANAPADSTALAEPSEDAVMTPPPSSAPDTIRPAEGKGLIASSTEGQSSTAQTASDPTPMEVDSPPTAAPAESTPVEPPTSSNGEPSTSEPSISVYKPPTSSTPQAAKEAYNPADFVPTVEHAQSHQAVLAKGSQNRRLQSDAEVAAANQQKTEALSLVKSATIRVRFPDQMQVDLTINATDTATTFYEKVKDMLRDETLDFELRYTSSKGAPVTLAREGKEAQTGLIKGLGWKGRVLVTMVWGISVPSEKRTRVLKEHLVGQAVELSVPVPVAAAASSNGNVNGATAAKPAEAKKAGNKGDFEAKMKKMLGFGKK